jgi:glycosyltransferase involved in cell wall biosynthesis
MGPTGDPEDLKQAFYAQWPDLRGKSYLLFLGRIHPKKGCDLLIEAFAREARPDLHLVMAGPDETGWGAELRIQAQRLSVSERITWTGMLRGKAKWGAFYGSQAFILPSHQENFGIAVADALACGVIPLISDKVNIARDIAADGAGWIDTDTVEGAGRLVATFQSATFEKLGEMRKRALDCYRRRYALNNAAEALYSVLGLA